MSTSATLVYQGVQTYVADVIATADGDTSIILTHGLGVAPADVQLTALSAAGALSTWAWTATTSTTTITLTKSTATGSGAAPVQLRAIVRAPHSIGR